MYALRFVRGTLCIASVTVAAAASAQIVTGKIQPIAPSTGTVLTATVMPQCTSASKYHIDGFWVLPRQASNPVEGQQVEIYLDFKNDCNVPLNLPWKIYRNGMEIASGVAYNIPAGQLFEAKTIWSATPGAHDFAGYVDPSNTYGDTGPDRLLRMIRHSAYSVYAVPRWTEWAASAKTGAQNGMRAAIAQAKVTGAVNAAYGKIQRGGVDGGVGYIMGPVYAAMVYAPEPIKLAVVNALKDAWNNWAVNYEMTTVGLLSWPLFTVWPLYDAPAQPPLLSTVQVKFGNSSGDASFDAASLAALIKSRVPTFEANYAGADAAINGIAQFVSDRFTAWKGSGGTVCSIMGGGRVPTMFLTPPTPGPVVNGTITAKLCGDF